VAQINLFIDTIIASYFNSGVSYLYYADRINELPLAVIGIAVGTALLPMLSRQIREGRHDEAVKSQNHAIELALFLSLPAAVALMVIAEPIITIMFQRHAFGVVETIATYKALIAFAIGLPAFILAKILAPGFYANQDTTTPFKIAMVCIAVNLFFNLTLMGPLKHVGMALATSIAGWVNVILMAVILRKRTWLLIDPALLSQIARILLASGVMALVLYGLRFYSDPYMQKGEILRTLVMMVVVAIGAGGYFITGLVCNTMNLRAVVLKRLRRAT
jgi:putative peptidoglycan lipid II flippase